MTTRTAAPAELDLTRYIRAGDTVLWGQATGEPTTLTSALFEQHHEIGEFRCFLGTSLPGAPRPSPHDGVSFSGYCTLGTNRVFADAGAFDVVPSHYSHLPDLIRSRRIPIDVVLLLLPPPDADGTHSMGLVDEYVGAALDSARTIVAEVNSNVPRTTSGRRIHGDDLDLVVRSTRPLLESPARTPTDVDRAIAARVSALVPDGATLQIGLGALPAAILQGLADHRDLGIHSGMISDEVVELIEAGAVTNARKPLDTGITVAGLLMGSQHILDHVDGNDRVVIRETEYTHDQGVLRALPCFTAINSAFEVDLTGQVNAESIGGRYLGAVGGAADFLRGAHQSPGGLPLIVLPATANGTSRIVPQVQGPVSTARSDIGLVVTQHGVADLRGASLPQRVERMLQIADPEHRQRLAAESERLLSRKWG